MTAIATKENLIGYRMLKNELMERLECWNEEFNQLDPNDFGSFESFELYMDQRDMDRHMEFESIAYYYEKRGLPEHIVELVTYLVTGYRPFSY